MKKLKKILNNNKGAYSILAAILILIMATIFTGYLDILNKKWALSEVQTVMDTSGINTLQNQVNNKALRAEILSLDPNSTNIKDGDYADKNNKSFTVARQQKYKSDMSLYYKKELEKQIKGNHGIRDYNVERVDVVFSYDKWGLGETKTKLPQISLDSVVTMKVATTSFFDDVTSISRTMYSSRNNANFTVTYNGKDADGNAELIIRSVTRLVYK